MIKLSKNYQFGTKVAADQEDLLGADIKGNISDGPKVCKYEDCGLPMKMRYPGNDPENGPACLQCASNHSLCEVCDKPINGTGTCDECMQEHNGPGAFGDELPFDESEEGPEPYDNDANDVGAKKAYDARREAATPHAHAAKDLFSKRRALMEQINQLDDQLSGHREVLRALDPKMRHEAYADDKELKNYLRPEKVVDKKKKKRKMSAHASKQVIEGLLKVADVLDYAGDPEGVTLVESMLQIFAKKEDGMPKYDIETVEKTQRKYPDIATIPPSMSTRNCPDHHGMQMKRVAEGTFQCELDGRMYNWNQGFKDYSGNTYPAAPIRSVDFPDTTERMFETREMATNKKTK